MDKQLTTPEALLEKIIELLEKIVENTTPAETPADATRLNSFPKL